jgi:1,2-diacylglycerol 3-alpha-glucosyltransferase
MPGKEIIRIAYVQRILPTYRYSFLKTLISLTHSYHFTLLCKQGVDKVKHIETVTTDVLNSFTKNGRFSWKDTDILCYHMGKILWQKGLLKPISKKEFDVIILSSQITHLGYWLILLACKLRGVKIIFWSHGLRGNEKGFTLWLKKWYLSLADVNLVYADYNKQIMIKAGMDINKIKVVYNSLDISEQDRYYSEIIKLEKKELKRQYIKNNYPSILFVSRLRKEKRVDILLKAVHLLKTRNINVNVLIVGDGSELENIKELTNDLGLNDTVQFLGRIYKESELVKYFYISDVFVSPGQVGLNCIHAFSYGVPVITHNDFRYQNPEVEAIIEKENGIFFNKDDVKDLAEKLEYWLTNHTKEESSEKARNRVKNYYTPEVQAKFVLEGISSLYEN